MTNKHWFALYLSTDDHRKVSDALSRKNIEHYVPSCPATDRTRDQRRIGQVALFPRLIFVRIEREAIGTLKNIQGVVNVLFWQKEPAEFRDAEIERIRQFIESHRKLKLQKIAVRREEVRISPAELAECDDILLGNKTINSLVLPRLGYMILAEEKAKIELAPLKVSSETNSFRRLASRKMLNFKFFS